MRIARVLVVAAVLVGLAAAPTAARPDARLRADLLRLEETEVSLEFDAMPLRDAVRRLSLATGVNLAVAPVVFAERSEDDLAVTLTLRKLDAWTALKVLLDVTDLKLVHRHGVLFVTTPKDALGKPKLVLHLISDLTFAIRDFPGPDLMLRPAGAEFEDRFGDDDEGREHAFGAPEEILDLVSENTGDGTWDHDGVSISVNDRFLIVRQYPSVQREIANLLDMLRAYR